MKKIFATLACVFMSWVLLYATVWRVGPSRTYTMPSQVSTLVQNGDTVLIDSGIYNSDVALWNADSLLLQGTGGGYAHLQANGQSYGGKAIWVINGHNTVVDSIEFSLCTCASNNGAGIRQQGANLIVRHCYFHDNQDGILTSPDTLSNILIEYSEFYNNGYGDGYTHNLYIGQVHSLTFQYNYTHHAKVGHELKSRAINNYILYNRFEDDSTGTASRSMDLPNGGLAIVIGNEIEKGPQAQNSNFMEFGLEGLINPGPQQLYVINNTFVNDKTTGSFIDMKTGADLCKAWNNIFAGPGTIIISDSTAIDTSHNFITTIANAGLVNTSAYDYHLLSTSVAVNNGAAPGNAGAYSLTPLFEYVQPLAMNPRVVNGVLDIGAHEFDSIMNAVFLLKNEELIVVYPNPAQNQFTVDLPFVTEKCEWQLFDLNGKLMVTKETGAGNTRITFSNLNLPEGVYIVRGKTINHTFANKVIVNP